MGVQLGDMVVKEKLDVALLGGKQVAIDAYNVLYQFLSIIRQRDGTPLRDSRGRVTSHLSGMFYRTARLLEAGVKPVYIF
ncbi:MAG: flap structure-specific endonuclease, partial [Candidatus Aenigmarchaeota archaeon]|nr:flap structure-specific endonuclease [Candidatus Aenigmarchaeota archaeon]